MNFGKHMFARGSKNETEESLLPQDDSETIPECGGDVVIDLSKEKSVSFEKGHWVVKRKSPSSDEDTDLLKRLTEENNFLRLKIEVLLNMIAELQSKYEEHTTGKASSGLKKKT